VTPHEIDLLMHYYSCADDHAHAHHQGVRETLLDLCAKDLLFALTEPTQYGANWRLTERGEVYCAALTMVPLPVMRWVIPDEDTQGQAARP
jgi:hypothetical protein